MSFLYVFALFCLMMGNLVKRSVGNCREVHAVACLVLLFMQELSLHFPKRASP